MPYTKDSLPAAVKRLPDKAQEIWLAAFNAAYQQYGNEERAFATAWAAVKRKYRQTDDGEWVPMTDMWIRVLPMGEVRLSDDRPPFFVDRESLAAIIEAWRRRGNDLVVDYEHQTLNGTEAPAAGWIKELEARDDGLWARVEWTDRARRYLESREYRYFSPVVKLDEERRVMELLNVALTNFPAISQLTPLAARADYQSLAVWDVEIMADRDKAREAQEARAKRYGIGIKEGGHVTKPGEWSHVPDEQFADPVNYRYPMPDYDQTRAAWAYWNKPKNQEQYNAEERRIITNRILRRAKEVGMTVSVREEAKMDKIAKHLQLPDGAGEYEILTAIDALRQQVPIEILSALDIAAGASVQAVVDQIKLLRLKAEHAEAVHRELAEVKEKLKAMEAERLINEALSSGRTTPAEIEKLGHLAKDNPQLFVDLVMSRPEGSMVPLKTLGAGKPEGESDDKELMVWCRMMGITPEQYKASAQQIRERGY